MALQPGTRLGSFEVLGPLGAGGMGEVYRARDSRLGREVAIKVLPDAFARDAARVARFEREARLLAAINHPAIGAIYGAEEFDSLQCIIMELVAGETLAERMARGALPLEEACDLARQIAEALEAAHEKGVVHRDLKPSNIKITPEGKVKVLDLGLAKAMETPALEDVSRSPTMPLGETRPGEILGTVEFMSPEQARGKTVDKRTDIWAFGCILFEMLAGRRAFTAETSTDVLVAIVSAEPDWSALPAQTPPRLRELLSRCLQKDANKRLRDIGDARIAIEETLAPAPSAGAPRRGRRILGAGAILMAFGAIVALTWLATHRRSASLPPLPEQISLAVLAFRDLSGQPNGQLLADGFADTLSVRLAKVPGIQVVNPSAATRAGDQEPDPYRAAATLGANVVLRGSLQRSNEQMRILFQVLDIHQKRQVAADEVTGPASDLFAMQDRVADKVASDLNRQFPPGSEAASGLVTAGEQERYMRALGSLLRYDKPGAVDAAIELLQGLAAERPASALVHAALARAYLNKYSLTRKREWADQATASSATAQRLDPRLPEVDVTVGDLSLATGKPGEAVTAFRRALAAQPRSFEALLGLARALDAAGNAPEAEATHRRTVELQPSYWIGYSKFGGFYFNHGRYPDAAKMFRRVTELTPDNARAFGNLGACYVQMDLFEEALAACRRSLAIEPTSFAYSNAGVSEFYIGRYSDASRDFEKAVALTPDRSDGWADLADAYHWSGRKAEAGEAYARAIRMARSDLQVNPRNPTAHARLAVCLAHTGEPGEAREEIDRAVALAEQDPRVLYDAAIVASVGGRPGEALRWIARAVAAGCGVLQLRREPEFSRLRTQKEFEQALQQKGSNKL